jgi:hypothetical protein
MRPRRAALLLSSVLLCAAPVLAQDAPLSVRLDGDRLSVSAREIGLADVLAEVSKVSGVAIAVDEGLAADIAQDQVTVTLEAMPLEEAMRRILGGRDALYLYSASGLAEVRVYGAAQGSARVRAQPGRAATTSGRPTKTPPAKDDAALERLEQARRAALARQGPPAPPKPDDAMSVERAIQALGSERSTEVLERALETLADQESVPVEPLLEFVRQRGRDAELRVQALEMLDDQTQGDERVTRLLRDLSTQDPNEDVRDAAKDMLERRRGSK